MARISASQSGILGKALDQIPKFRALEKAETAIKQRQSELRSPTAPAPDLGMDALTALLDGSPIPTDLGRRAWEDTQRSEFVKAELQILIGMENRLPNLKENALYEGAPRTFPVLRAALDELVAEARPMAEILRSVHDADSAIEAGPKGVAAWSGFGKLVQRYRELRLAQDVMTRAAAGRDTIDSRDGGTGGILLSGVIPVWSEIANVTEVWPEYWPARRDGENVPPPWPIKYAHRPFEIEHNREWLLWLLNAPGVRLWVPTVNELADAFHQQRADAADRRGKAPKDRKREPLRSKPEFLVSHEGTVREPGQGTALLTALSDLNANQNGED
ncbi:hypothetical protein ACWEFL_28035 [Streptomyces sp. NPDC004838]